MELKDEKYSVQSMVVTKLLVVVMVAEVVGGGSGGFSGSLRRR